MEKQKKRFDELEGLRGFAAAMVVIYHFLLAFYIVTFFGTSGGNVQHMRFEDNLYGSPFTALFSGTFMVAIFFVLSGFVLSIGFFQTGKASIVKKLAAKRYIRLMIPALASVMIAFLLLSAGLVFLKQEVSVITGSEWLQKSWRVTPDFFTAIQSGAFGSFIKQGNPYNNVLWTMVYEFAGSFLVFGSLLIFGKLKYRWVFYGFLAFATFNTWFFAFVAGMVMADLYARGYLVTKKYRWWVTAPLVAGVLFLGAYPYKSVEGTLYQYITLPSLDINWSIFYLTIASIGAVAAVLLCKQIAVLFRRSFMSKLGKYTFALYLIHLPVLYTFGMAMFLVFYQKLELGYNLSALLAIATSMPLVAGVTVLFERYIDAPSVRLSSYVANILLGYSEPPKVMKKLKLAYRRTLRQFAIRIRKQPELIPDELDAE